MDLAAVYRAIAKKHFPKAIIVADRFHVIRLVNHDYPWPVGGRSTRSGREKPRFDLPDAPAPA